MSLSLASLAAALLPFVPSPQDQDKPRVLDASAVRSLNKEAKVWFAAWQKYEYDSPKPTDRRKNGKRLQRARDKFMRTWKSKSKKGDPLSSVADVKAVFANPFKYDRQQTSGIIKQVAGQSEGAIRLTPGVLYPLLHQLEKQGLLLSDWESVQAAGKEDGAGRRRKWYRLSAKGKKRLAQRVDAHRSYLAVIESFLPDAKGATP